MKLLRQGQWTNALHLEMPEDEFRIWKATEGCFRVASDSGGSTHFFLIGGQPVLVTVRDKKTAEKTVEEYRKQIELEA